MAVVSIQVVVVFFLSISLSHLLRQNKELKKEKKKKMKKSHISIFNFVFLSFL